MSKISIVYLYVEVTGYVIGVLKRLIDEVSSIDVVYWDNLGENSTKYKINSGSKIKFHERSKMKLKDIELLLNDRSPSIIYMSGWMDYIYSKACVKYKENNPSTLIISGLDGQWNGTLKQIIGQYFFKIFYRSLFDFVWISGPPQFAYAQRLGYDMGNIIHNLYSADSDLFIQKSSILKRFVYVGRFVKIKAPDLLAQAYCMLSEESQKEWPLYFIGDGELREELKKYAGNIHVLPFMQPTDLLSELKKGGVACMPSNKDQWCVAVHEYALMGMPLLLSSGVGASTEFLISGYNGFQFKKSDINSLFKALKKYVDLSDDQLAIFSKNSLDLSSKINVNISVFSLLSILQKKEFTKRRSLWLLKTLLNINIVARLFHLNISKYDS